MGAIAASTVLFIIASGRVGFEMTGSNPFATNGFGVHSPGGYSLFACLITEVLLTFMFLMVILGATDRRAPQGFAPIAIGLALTLIHLISIPVTNTSVNPARSTGPAIFAGVELFQQVWLFWVAPILGALVAGFFYLKFFDDSASKKTPEGDVMLSKKPA
jgi:aquaporin Z